VGEDFGDFMGRSLGYVVTEDYVIKREKGSWSIGKMGYNQAIWGSAMLMQNNEVRYIASLASTDDLGNHMISSVNPLRIRKNKLQLFSKL
jgi:hypothetical protein